MRLLILPDLKMERVAHDLRAALQEENHELLRNCFNELLKYISVLRSADVLYLLNKGLLSKCFSSYGCIPMDVFVQGFTGLHCYYQVPSYVFVIINASRKVILLIKYVIKEE